MLSRRGQDGMQRARDALDRLDHDNRREEARGMLAAATGALAQSNPRATAQTLYRLADEVSDLSTTDSCFDAAAAMAAREPMHWLGVFTIGLIAGMILSIGAAAL